MDCVCSQAFIVPTGVPVYLTEGKWRSIVRASFLMYQGASAIISSARFGTLWTFMTIESETMPHSWIQYVIEGTTIALNSKSLLPRLSLLVGLSNQLSFLSLALHVAAILVVCCFQVSRLSRIKPKHCAWGDCGMVISKSSTLGRIFSLKVNCSGATFFHLWICSTYLSTSRRSRGIPG